MVKKDDYIKARDMARGLFRRAGIIITPAEEQALEFADFGLDDFWNTGLTILTYVNTERVCAKELVLAPGQACPEHRHPPLSGGPGKEETFRCRYGTVYLYVPGLPKEGMSAPEGSYSVFHEIVLRPGEQFTIMPDTRHWFRAGDEGAVVSEFSTKSMDEGDIFTDARITRTPEVEK